MNGKPITALKLMGVCGFLLSISIQSLSAQQVTVPASSAPPNARPATVLEYTVWPLESIRDATPAVTLDGCHNSVTVNIHTSKPYRSDLEYYAVPGMTLEAFTSIAVDHEFAGTEIEGNVGVNWRSTRCLLVDDQCSTSTVELSRRIDL